MGQKEADPFLGPADSHVGALSFVIAERIKLLGLIACHKLPF
jgi:hypothetical protein